MNIDIKPITSVLLILTNDCPLHCKYCFEQHKKDRMSYEIAMDTLNFLYQTDSPSYGICFFGGEPCLYWDELIVPIVEKNKQLSKPVSYSISTNGVLLTKERIDWIAENKFAILLSLDGDKQTQDINRPFVNQNSSFDIVKSNLEYCLTKFPGIEVNSVLTPATVQNYYHDMMFLKDLGVKVVKNSINLFEFWDEKSKKELQKQQKMLEEYIIDSFRHDIYPLIPEYLSDSFIRIKEIFNTSKGRRENNFALLENQCGFGRKGSCTVGVDGTLYSCYHPTTDKFKIGNIYDGLNKERIKELISEYSVQKMGGNKCNTCPLDRVCNGGCAPNNYIVTGNMNIVPDIYCFWQRILSDSAYRICNTLGKENNKLFVRWFGNV